MRINKVEMRDEVRVGPSPSPSPSRSKNVFERDMMPRLRGCKSTIGWDGMGYICYGIFTMQIVQVRLVLVCYFVVHSRFAIWFFKFVLDSFTYEMGTTRIASVCRLLFSFPFFSFDILCDFSVLFSSFCFWFVVILAFCNPSF